MDVVLATARAEFAHLADAGNITGAVIRLAIALILGALLGLERQLKGHAAGLRTHMLVALGAALAVIAPIQAGMPIEDLSRVIQGIVVGVGFLGAGTILKLPGDEIRGLTTAAGIWLTAGVGVAAGLGLGGIAFLGTVMALFVLGVLHRD